MASAPQYYDNNYTQDTGDAEQTQECNPWSFKYALIWYVFLIIISVIISIVLVVQAHQSPKIQQTNSGFFVIVVSLIVSFLWFIFVLLMMHWMHKEAKQCKTATTWLVFLIALLLPIIINVFFGLLASLV